MRRAERQARAQQFADVSEWQGKQHDAERIAALESFAMRAPVIYCAGPGCPRVECATIEQFDAARAKPKVRR